MALETKIEETRNGAAYFATAVVRIENDSLHATVTISGSPNRDGDHLLGYQLYANNQLLASALSPGGAAVFTLTAPYAGGAAVLGLCPVYSSGERTDEAMIIPINR